MNKNKLFTIITVASLLTVSISLISMMSLTPSIKDKNSHSYKKDKRSLEGIHSKISTDFILKTTSGEEFRSNSLRGKFILIYFGSTYCPSISVPHLIEMQNILDKLNAKHGNDDSVKFLFITADPTNDTQKHLHDYFKKLDSKIIPLTGEKEKINKLLKNFKAHDILFKDKIKTQSVEEESQQPACIISAPSPFYLIGKDGEFIKNYNPKSTSLSIAENILHYMAVS
jgi:protein SCO1/2